MIVLDRVSITLKDRTRRSMPLDDVSIGIPSDRRVGLLGQPKSGKTTLLKLLSGLSRPSSGRIYSDGTISFPVGAAVGIVAQHSLRRNAATAAKIYRVDPIRFIQIVAEASGCRPFLDLPFSYVPTEIATKFRYAVTYALPFDTYLMDGTPMPFMQNPARMDDLLATRLSSKGFILASANESTIGKYCDVIFLIGDGKVVQAHDATAAIVGFRTVRMARNRDKADPNELKTLVREARHLLQLGDNQAAEAKAQEAYEKYPDELEVLLLLADVSRAGGNRAQANEMLKRACDSFPDREEPWMALQRFLSADGDAATALPWGEKMLQQASPKIRYAGARVIHTYGSPEDALAAWRTVVGTNPTTTLGLTEMANLQFKLGRYEDALATTETELGLDPAAWRALQLKAKAEHKLDRLAAVTDTTLRLAEVKPDFSLPYVAILRRSGHNEQADRLLKVIQGAR